MLPLNFNSHAHVERDTFCKRFNKWAIEFQLTRSRGAWHTTGAGTAIVFNFNSHAHVERDKSTIFMSLSGVNFNSHAHVERDFCIIDKTIRFVKFQLTRSRGAWLTICKYCWGLSTISTHTLTWSVTEYQLTCHTRICISTHTLTWSVTAGGHFSWWFGKFQLTRSRGAWPDFLWNADETKFHFNSHAHVERDSSILNRLGKCEHFNSHAHVERDFGYSALVFKNEISTHTLTWSVTLWNEWYYNFIVISTHTLTWSVTKFQVF